MKTIAYNGSKKNLGRALFVIAALGGLYYLRRQGKSMTSIVSAGAAGFKAAQGLVGRVAPSVMTGLNSGASRSQSTSSVSSGAQI